MTGIVRVAGFWRNAASRAKPSISGIMNRSAPGRERVRASSSASLPFSAGNTLNRPSKRPRHVLAHVGVVVHQQNLRLRSAGRRSVGFLRFIAGGDQRQLRPSTGPRVGQASPALPAHRRLRILHARSDSAAISTDHAAMRQMLCAERERDGKCRPTRRPCSQRGLNRRASPPVPAPGPGRCRCPHGCAARAPSIRLKRSKEHAADRSRENARPGVASPRSALACRLTARVDLDLAFEGGLEARSRAD